jgi:hypothetical protein
VRFGSKADVTPLNFDVRFTPESGHYFASDNARYRKQPKVSQKNKKGATSALQHKLLLGIQAASARRGKG